MKLTHPIGSSLQLAEFDFVNELTLFDERKWSSDQEHVSAALSVFLSYFTLELWNKTCPVCNIFVMNVQYTKYSTSIVFACVLVSPSGKGVGMHPN